MFRNTWNQRTNPSQHIWRVWDQNLGKKKILKFFHFDNLICILWSNLEVSYDSGSLVSCWHMSRGQPSQTVLKSVHLLALYDFLKFYLIYYPTAPLKIFYLKIKIKIPFLDSCDSLTVSRVSRKGGGGRGSGRRRRMRG